MNHLKFIIIFLCSVLLIQPDISFSQNLNAEIICPYSIKSGDMFPIIIKVKNDDQSLNSHISEEFQLISQTAIFDQDIITLVSANENFYFYVDGLSGQKSVIIENNLPVIEVQGQITSDADWTSGNIYQITDDLLVPVNVTLSIHEGTRVILAEKTNFRIDGNLQINGTNEKPVLFQPESADNPWGGIIINTEIDTTIFNYGIFILGGNDENHIFGHSESQPVIMLDSTNFNINHCFIIDNPGKALGGDHSLISLDNCVISRCDTGGEYHSCLVNMSNSYFLEIPNDDGIMVDDDNDASYFYGIYNLSAPNSVVKNCVFISGKDDGIDHNGANLLINNCWIEGFYHEGIAASNANEIWIYNTLVKDCEQGIEAGYGEPYVNINHCTIIDNEIGIRFGDSYTWGCEGHIEMTNSILYENADNILNYDLSIPGPVTGAINASYSMTNDEEYNSYPNCIEGIPEFDEDFLIIPGTTGTGLASDGYNMGRIDPSLSIDKNTLNLLEGVYLAPNPVYYNSNLVISLSKNAEVEIKIIDINGAVILTKKMDKLSSGSHSILIDFTNLPHGVYILNILVKGKWSENLKVIKV